MPQAVVIVDDPNGKNAMTSRQPAAGHGGRSHGRPWPITLLFGAVLIIAAAILLGIDVHSRGGVIVPDQPLPAPRGALETIARSAAINMTPLCWVGFLLVADGLLEGLGCRRAGGSAAGGSPARRRPKRFVLCFLFSVPIWLFFDWVNFSFMDAWRYHNLPESIVHRYIGYFVAFGAICPGMFLAAELYQRLGLRRLRGYRIRFGMPVHVIFIIVGVACLVFPIVIHDPSGSVTLWLGPLLLLDPINRAVGAPSILGDWEGGRWGRTIALMAAGLTCGLLWESTNYFAAAKWTYNLPFLGPLEQYRYFEMPWPGLLGFLFFGIGCWNAFVLVTALIRRASPRLIEDLPDEYTVL
jgi:hypothetical protein